MVILGIMDTRRSCRMLAAAAVMALAGAVLIMTAILPAHRSFGGQGFDVVYYNALLSGRDPDAALRKVRLRTNLLVRELGMTVPTAAALAVRSVISGTHNLCGGG